MSVNVHTERSAEVITVDAWRAKVSKAICSAREFSRESFTGRRKSYGVGSFRAGRRPPCAEDAMTRAGRADEETVTKGTSARRAAT